MEQNFLQTPRLNKKGQISKARSYYTYKTENGWILTDNSLLTHTEAIQKFGKNLLNELIWSRR